MLECGYWCVGAVRCSEVLVCGCVTFQALISEVSQMGCLSRILLGILAMIT